MFIYLEVYLFPGSFPGSFVSRKGLKSYVKLMIIWNLRIVSFCYFDEVARFKNS